MEETRTRIAIAVLGPPDSKRPRHNPPPRWDHNRDYRCMYCPVQVLRWVDGMVALRTGELEEFIDTACGGSNLHPFTVMETWDEDKTLEAECKHRFFFI